MFDVAADHAPGLYIGLLVLPFALIAVRLRAKGRSVPGTVKGASVLMGVAGGVHLGLVPSHWDERITAVLFMCNGISYLVLSQLFAWRHWRSAAVGLITATLIGYVGYIALGLDSPDQVAITTKLIELTALGLVLIPVRTEAGRPHRILRWSALGVALPLLTVIVTATVWIDDLARPDALHAHAGALLQQPNDVATPDQLAAANQLYEETKASIAPFVDWRVAWAAGYRPNGPTDLPSTHWMNQHYVDAGYVLDPRRPQGLVYANSKHGPVLLGAMFQMKHLDVFGPDPGGPLTAWHIHTNICVTPFGFAFSLMSPTATCPVGAIDITAPAMLHVWIVDNPDGGRFAVDIDPNVVKLIDQG